jgi:hypothetical protein
MKTVLAVLASGLIGGGAAIGAVALNLVPMQTKTNQVATDVSPLEGDESPAPRSSAEYEKQIADLNRKYDTLEAKYSQRDGGVRHEEVEALKAQLAALKKNPATVAKKAAGDTPADAGDAPNPVDPQFENAVRDVYTKIEAERTEKRRTEMQARRLEQLEQAKQRAAEFIPKLVEARASALNIPEASIKDVSTSLVSHAQYLAEIRSEAAGKRINGEVVDRDATQKKIDDLNQTTISALTSYVDEDTAKNLVGAVSRAGRDNNNNNRRRGRRGGNR